VTVTAAKALATPVETDDEIKGMKIAAIIPAGMSSIESCSFGLSNFSLVDEDASAGMHLELLCQV
jgi:hypothetical protein